MIIIAGNSHPELAQKIANKLKCKFIIANTKKFANHELKVQINQDLYQQDIIIIQSTTRPANDHLIELLLLADTARRANCNKITAVIPYFGYSRQDRICYKHGPISANIVAKIIETSGINRIITIDLHSQQSAGFFKIRVKNINPINLFVPEFTEHENYMVISPDLGSISRAKILATKLNTKFATINKSRNSKGECVMSEIIGNVAGKDCIIVDDIVDTGNTLCKALELLIQNHAKSVSSCITHAVFSDDCLNKIKQAGFSKFFITDTICNRRQNLPEFIKIIHTHNLIAEIILNFLRN